MDPELFLSENKSKYEIVSELQNRLNNISEEQYEEIITYVTKNTKTFFENRESALLFVWNIHIFTIYNFSKLELILDVLCHFITQIRSAKVQDNDIIDIMTGMKCCVYYLYTKNIISLKTIILKSVLFPDFFAYFYPEIDCYDHEYAEKQKTQILGYKNKELLINFLLSIISDVNEHKKNREGSFHPSPLHKAIRDDDINEFQSILSLNNYSINYNFEYSYYERTLTECNTPSLIQIAATYGSTQIFKFLWMQPNIIFDDNLICYAISGRNYEIIHICETKCSRERALLFSINSHQHELTDYFIENSEEDEENKATENYEDDEDNMYKYLSKDLLIVALRSANYHIFLPCLKRVAYIMDNIEDNITDTSYYSFLRISIFDYDLFRFLYSHKSSKIDLYIGQYPILLQWIYNGMTDALNYIIKDLKSSEILKIFKDSLLFNSNVTNFLIDLQFSDESFKNSETYDYFYSMLGHKFFYEICKYYNEDLVIKVSHLYHFIRDPGMFLDKLMEMTSNKFISSLFKENKLFLSNVDAMKQALISKGFGDLAEIITCSC